MPYSIRFSSMANDDFDNILHFIAVDNPVRAISFVEDLRLRMTEVLTMFPNAGKRTGNSRMLSLDGYVVIYRVDDKSKAVYVLMVTEGHRDWQEILSERS